MHILILVQYYLKTYQYTSLSKLCLRQQERKRTFSTIRNFQKTYSLE